MAAEAKGPKVRDYVVLQEFPLVELIESIIGGDLEVDADAWQRLLKADETVYVKTATVEAARNAPHAFKMAGQHMRRPHDRPVVVEAVAVPATQWSTEPVRLTPRLDVGVG